VTRKEKSMKIKSLLLLLVIVAAMLVAVSCAPAPTPAPTAVPTQPPAPTSAPAATSTPVAQPTEPAVASQPTLPPTNVTPTLIASVPKTADELQVILPEELKAMMEGGADIVIADAQPKEAFVLGHITGAVNVPWDMKIKSSGGLPKDKLVVVYCACAPDEPPSGTDAGDVAMQLISNFGYTKIAVMDGGWVKWMMLGYPTEKGN
jgi:rhodanese-related sulfurtransferase